MKGLRPVQAKSILHGRNFVLVVTVLVIVMTLEPDSRENLLELVLISVLPSPVSGGKVR